MITLASEIQYFNAFFIFFQTNDSGQFIDHIDQGISSGDEDDDDGKAT
jgi:hypothetical protein